jgi:hypothetical protein
MGLKFPLVLVWYSLLMKTLMGPYHDFWVFDEAQRIPQDFLSLLGSKDAPLRIEDDLLLEFSKILPEFQTNIPSGNPQRPHHLLKLHPYQGINWFGPTIVRGKSALLLAKVASHWCEAFETKEETMTFPIRPWYPDRNATEPITSLEVPRSIFRIRFGTLAELARQGGEPGCYLLHLGI